MYTSLDFTTIISVCEFDLVAAETYYVIFVYIHISTTNVNLDFTKRRNELSIYKTPISFTLGGTTTTGESRWSVVKSSHLMDWVSLGFASA